MSSSDDLLEHDVAMREANMLMVEALLLLDKCHHPAAARLDHAIVEIGLRDPKDGFPVEPHRF